MNRIDLPSPVPREQELPSEPFQYVTGPPWYIPLPAPMPTALLWDVIESRSSRRVFGPLTEQALSAVLWYSAKTRRIEHDKGRLNWESRPAPSAGGRHPIDVLVVDKVDTTWRIRLYDPHAHALSELCPANRNEVRRFGEEITRVVNPGAGTIIWFIADWTKIHSRYEHGESLVWRDAGALLALFYLASEGLGLSCCAVGMTGDPMISSAVDGNQNLFGVGGCVIGAQK